MHIYRSRWPVWWSADQVQICPSSCYAHDSKLVFLIQICSIILTIRVVAFSHPLYPASGSFCGILIVPPQPAPELDNPHFFVIKAQIVRAILFVSATATSILGFRATMRASHEDSGIDFRPSQFSRDIAPIISNLRMSD